MIFSSSERLRGPVEDAQARRTPPRALLAVGGRRLLVPSGGGTIGRSRECDVVLEDAGVSRRHAEIRPGPDGWTVADLGSTNGVRVNGAEVRGAYSLAPGDRVELGSTEIVFEIS
jgi:predicted component of type VI protein secretion system